ncbi:hypothetical protein AC1031_006613 [Aphanomyces cochlioides]|nr:hypothetical protein AC1031_006613 [Aphanomyces cochlioides]
MASEFGGSGILFLEHINLGIQDGGEATTPSGKFYLDVLGCARDPRLEWLVHANMGLNQFHILPNERVNQRFNGEIGLFYTDLDALAKHFNSLSYPYEDVAGEKPGSFEQWDLINATKYKHLAIMDPSQNKLVCFESPLGYVDSERARGTQPGASSMGDGIPYMKFLVRPGTASGIARFYQRYLGAACKVLPTRSQNRHVCSIACGPLQKLLFEESDDDLLPYDGHHICLYIDNFEASYKQLAASRLNWNTPLFGDRCDTWELTQKNQQFRFIRVEDPESGELLLELEHEVRSVAHPRWPMFS